MGWYLEALKKYAVFDGRSRRSEYWYFFLYNLLFSVALTLLDLVAGTYSPSARIGLFEGLYSLAVLLPSVGVGIRRLHDTNRSGWWFLVALVPLVGIVVLIVFLAEDSDSGTNRYGPNPKLAPPPY